MQIKLSRVALAVAATTLMFSSTTVLASHHKAHHPAKEAAYKEAAYKDAMPCPKPLQLMGGFYLGAQAGYDSYSVGLSRAITVGTTTANGNPTMSANGAMGGLFAGYGMYWNNFYYLGAEFFANDSAAGKVITTTRNNPTVGFTSSSYARVNPGWSYGVSLLPGLKVNDGTLAYLRLGYSRVNFISRDTFASQGLSVSGSSSLWKGAFQYGLGMEAAVYQNFSVRGEYSHAGYGSFKDNGTGTKFSPSNNEFTVGVAYHFA
jgi:opacity protein-like surface antigen